MAGQQETGCLVNDAFQAIQEYLAGQAADWMEKVSELLAQQGILYNQIGTGASQVRNDAGIKNSAAGLAHCLICC